MLAPEAKPLWPRTRVALSTIDGIVSARLGTTRISGNARPAVFNRQVAMYLAKYVGNWSTTQIGKFYNGRDHSTVCYALKRIEAMRAVDSENGRPPNQLDRGDSIRAYGDAASPRSSRAELPSDEGQGRV